MAFEQTPQANPETQTAALFGPGQVVTCTPEGTSTAEFLITQEGQPQAIRTETDATGHRAQDQLSAETTFTGDWLYNGIRLDGSYESGSVLQSEITRLERMATQEFIDSTGQAALARMFAGREE